MAGGIEVASAVEGCCFAVVYVFAVSAVAALSEVSCCAHRNAVAISPSGTAYTLDTAAVNTGFPDTAVESTDFPGTADSAGTVDKGCVSDCAVERDDDRYDFSGGVFLAVALEILVDQLAVWRAVLFLGFVYWVVTPLEHYQETFQLHFASFSLTIILLFIYIYKLRKIKLTSFGKKLMFLQYLL